MTKSLEEKLTAKAKRYRKILANSRHLTRIQFIDMLHEVLKNSLVHLVEQTLRGNGSSTGAWRDLLEKSYYLLDSCGEGFSESTSSVETIFVFRDPDWEHLAQNAERLRASMDASKDEAPN